MAIMKHDMKAILGEDFFKEEVRCDYRISEKMKFTWALQIDLYLLFSEICEKYNLKYFLFYGGLLGAIRHNGFIPWDDDLDVAMPREDYNVFMKIAPKLLSDPYSLQNPYTYPNCYYSVATLRNSQGTFTAEIFKNLDYNKGIPLDIFPIDYCDPNTYESDRKLIFENIMRCSTWMKWKCGVNNERQKNDIERYGVEKPLEAWQNIHNIASNPSYKSTGYCGIPTLIANINRNPKIYPNSCFKKSVLHKFENIEVPIPVGYDEILTTLYGEYMKYPPIEERGIKTKGVIFDPYTPYKEYDFSIT